MSTYTQIIYQIVFSTKYRKPVFTKDKKEELLKYINGVIKNKNCHLYQINVVDDHLHIVTHIHPTISLSSLVKDIKVSSSIYIKEKNILQKIKSFKMKTNIITMQDIYYRTIIQFLLKLPNTMG